MTFPKDIANILPRAIVEKIDERNRSRRAVRTRPTTTPGSVPTANDTPSTPVPCSVEDVKTLRNLYLRHEIPFSAIFEGTRNSTLLSHSEPSPVTT